jgi:hypothetical protein
MLAGPPFACLSAGWQSSTRCRRTRAYAIPNSPSFREHHIGLLVEKPRLCNLLITEFLCNGPVATFAPIRRRATPTTA